MIKFLKHAYEPLLILVLYLIFYLTVKKHLEHAAYYTVATLVALYFMPYKLYRRMYMDTPHKKLYAISALLIVAIIVLSAVCVYAGRSYGLKNTARVLFYLNIVIMLYSFFKAIEGRDYLAHFALIFFAYELIDRL